MMKTITIDTYQMPITDQLEQAFLEYYAYYTLPTQVKCRIDPRCKKFQWLWDDFRSALTDSWTEFLETAAITDQERDQLQDLLDEQDDSELVDQLELALELEAA